MLHSSDLHSSDVPASSPCPHCGAVHAAVIEDVSDEVTVYGCLACDTTWAQRHAQDAVSGVLSPGRTGG